jgi:hypothetical protein
MDLSLSTLLQLARFTVQSPREGARMVMRADLPMPARWVALALMAVVSSLMAHLSMRLMPMESQAQMGGMMASPIQTAILQAALMLVSVHAVYHIGRWRGGQGSFADALILMGWLQFLLLILQVVQIVTQIILPPLSNLIGFVSIGIFLWLISNFIAELHRFSSVFKTMLAVLATLFAAGFILSLLLLAVVGGRI